MTPPTTLTDACEFIVDCLHATASIQDSGFPLIRTPNIGKGRLDLDRVQRVSEDTYLKWTRRAVPIAGDLILAREAPAGNVAIVNDGDTVCLGQRTVHLRPDKTQVDPQYLCYFLLAPRQQSLLLAGETGATSKHVNMKDIRKLPLTGLPRLDVQQRVGRFIASYDDLIENNRRRIELLEEAAGLLYREWFVYFRFPGHEHVTITNGLPDGWESIPASEAFEANPATPRNDGGVITYVPMAALSEIGMTVDPSPIEQRHASTSVRFQNGDTLLARITPCLENGKTAFVYFLEDDEIACGSTEFIVLRGRKVSNYFVYLTAREDQFRGNAIKSMIGSSGRQRVQPDCFDRYFVPIPPKVIAELFEDNVSKIFEQIATLDKQSRKLAAARDLLLPRLMNGEIAV